MYLSLPVLFFYADTPYMSSYSEILMRGQASESLSITVLL